MRLIDADALREALIALQYKVPPENMNEACVRAVDYSECVKPAGWISVKDRLPVESCTVLVYHNHGGMQVLDYSKKHKLFNCHDWNEKAELDSFKIETVTHWHPLPKPPKEESDG